MGRFFVSTLSIVQTKSINHGFHKLSQIGSERWKSFLQIRKPIREIRRQAFL
jgi:hypothetical protein